MTKPSSAPLVISHDRLVVGERSFPFEIRRNSRARRMLLRVMPRDGAVILVLPTRASLRSGQRFVAEQAEWILARQDERPQVQLWHDGAILPLNGAPHIIRHRPDARGGVWVEGKEIHVSGQAEHLPRRLRDWLKRRARDEFGAAARQMAAELGVKISRITVRDTQSRWGSCSAHGHLSFSWRLLLAPPVVTRYLVAHEVAHLKHMDHSPAFWRLCAQLLGSENELRTARTWLRRHGAALHLHG
ncbi:SprT family zinc-dependent metalloprotease [uncultured Ferrovibrio sp.]|uniref:M48 family metallopeptidase n=1 Tax=uncultured Ferrovibrio sp. TaxID=1576913 RepID=UPI002630D039|nr:SprT family zinc-dependent metalloprotease [uncultured Ferrovibrio sp.]